MNNNNQSQGATVQLRPAFALYHANNQGAGSALKMEMIPAHADREGCVMLKIANQATIGDRKGKAPVYPTFDWANALVVKLGFSDLCAFLQVFRGECESIENGKGLYHASSAGVTKISLRHSVDVGGYSLVINRTPASGGELSAKFFFSHSEALGIDEALRGIMSFVCFGIPSVYSGYAKAAESVKKGHGDAAA